MIGTPGSKRRAPPGSSRPGSCGLSITRWRWPQRSTARGSSWAIPGYVEKEVAAGLLVQRFDLTIPVKKAYYLVYLEERLADQRLRAFRDWVVSESEIGTSERGGNARAPIGSPHPRPFSS